MKKPLIFLFPGQSSRDPEMFERLRAVSHRAADAALRRLEAHDVSPARLAFDTNLEIQLGVLVAALGYQELAHEHGLEAVASAGMSLGEYAHLVHIGALGPDPVLRLVAERGRAYDRGPEGVMYALQPVAREELEAVVARVRAELGGDSALVAVSNVNSPTQCVVAGRTDAVERVVALAEEELFAVAHLIERRIPMHMARFAEVADALLPALEQAPWQPPHRAYWPNVLGAPLGDPSREVFIERLHQHVSHPVEWSRTIDGLVEAHPGAVFVEVGPRRVLSALFGRRWHEGVRCYPLDLMQDAGAAAFARRVEEIRDAAG